MLPSAAPLSSAIAASDGSRVKISASIPAWPSPKAIPEPSLRTRFAAVERISARLPSSKMPAVSEATTTESAHVALPLSGAALPITSALISVSAGRRAAWLKTKATPPHAHGASPPPSLRAMMTPPTTSVISAPAIKV